MIALGTKVFITCSHEEGIVIARAEYLNAEPSYLIRYRCADGKAIEAWWTQQAIEVSPSES